MTPEQSRYLQKRVQDELDRAAKITLVYVQAIIKSMPRGVVFG